ncbi:PspA/IM30 family protein, partial [bacterium]|nr:PspA/IM30 family protein [bacterium]
DLRNKIPELNRQVAEVIKHEKMLEMQLERQTQTVVTLQPQVEAAVKAGPGRKEAAKALIVQLQSSQAEMAETQAALQKAKENSAQMLQMRTAFEQKVRQQMQEAMRQISRYKRAEAEKEMAEIMGSFEVGDEADELQRMTEKVDEKLARAEARLQVSSSSVDNQIAQIQVEASTDSAELAYQEYQRQLGLTPETPAAEQPAKTMEAIPVAPATPPAAPPAAPPPGQKREEAQQDVNWAQQNTDSQQQQ